jgi:hypothetical protein
MSGITLEGHLVRFFSITRVKRTYQSKQLTILRFTRTGALDAWWQSGALAWLETVPLTRRFSTRVESNGVAYSNSTPTPLPCEGTALARFRG